MNIKNVKTWVAALRSGEYTQCHNRMASSEGGYCCLGVAAKIAEIPFTVTTPIPGKRPILDNDGQVNEESYSLVSKWLDITQRIDDGLTLGNLANLNDLHRKTFSQIADYLEKEIEAYELSIDQPHT